MTISGWARDSVHLELFADSQKDTGFRLTSPLLEFRSGGQGEKHNAGLLLTSRNFFKQIPAELKIGNLSASGSLSKLNSPELPNGSSPFSSGISSVTGITASLPGYTSFSKPESSFLQLSINQIKKKPFSLSFNLLTSPDNASPVFSTFISDSFFSNQLIISSSWTAGEFFYKEKNSSSWFLDSPYYKKGSHFCTLFQLSADFKNKRKKAGGFLGLTAALYESPFGPYTAAYRTDFKLNFKETEFYTSAFLNAYEDTFTSSEKLLEPSSQFKTGLIYKKPLLINKSELAIIKIGINGLTKIKLIENEHPLRINTGIQLSTGLTSLSFSVSADAYMKSKTADKAPEEIKKDKLSFHIKNSWYLKSLTPGFSLTAEKQLSEKEADEAKDDMNYKIQLSLTNTAKHKFSASTAFSFTTKDGEFNGKKISAGLTCRLNFRYLTIIGKLSTSLE